MLDITNYFASFGGRTDAEKKLGHESWSDRLDCWDILMAENRGSGFGNEAVKRKKEENNMSEARQLQIQVEGLANLKELLKDHEGKKTFLMFIGSMCEEGDHIGESWCPDCRDVEPVVEAALQQAATDMVFILVVVGDKPTWKDPNNEFRTSEFKLTEIPTIVEYGTDNRLGCEDCKVQDKVNGFFPK